MNDWLFNCKSLQKTAALQTDGHIFQLVTETVIHASLQTRTDNIHSL
jgi:hypothetical protein